jgi:hypothetical protein
VGLQYHIFVYLAGRACLFRNGLFAGVANRLPTVAAAQPAPPDPHSICDVGGASSSTGRDESNLRQHQQHDVQQQLVIAPAAQQPFADSPGQAITIANLMAVVEASLIFH